MAISAFNGQAQDTAGNAVTAFQVEVRDEVTTNLASIFSDLAGTTPLGNPFTPSPSDNGHFRFYAEQGRYRIRVFDGGGNLADWRDVIVGVDTSNLLEESENLVDVEDPEEAFDNLASPATLSQVIDAIADATAALAAANISFKSVAIQVFTGSGTYTPTADTSYCLVISTGGGGGGGGADSDGSSSGAGGGGGAGSTCIEIFELSDFGSPPSVTVTIGAGGTAGANTGGNGGNGGNTTFGALHTAGGGVGGTGSAATVNDSVAEGGAGGSASNATINIPGGSGHVGIGSFSTTGFQAGGHGGTSFWGGGIGGQAGTDASTEAGVNATVYGTGASGARNRDQTSGSAGGVGAPGIVVVMEFIV